MLKQNNLSKNEKIGKRARHVARQIGGRIYVSGNNIYLVTGMPEFDPLFECLNKFKAPGPIDLGFSIDSLSAINKKKLNTWGQALQKWRQIKNFYEKRNEKNNKVQKWSKGIKKLSALHKGYWKILRSWKNNKFFQ